MNKFVFFMLSSLLIFDIAAPNDLNHLKTLHHIQNENIQILPETQTKVNVTVYYESLCPASINFIVTQLDPVSKTLENYLNIKMIPYGHATTYRTSDGIYYFKCQHGPDECFGNKLQACGIDHLGNNTKAVTFNACLLNYTKQTKGQGTDFVTALLWCSVTQAVQPYYIWQCATSEHGSVLLKNYAIETNKVNPRYVPHILLNNSASNEDETREDLMRVICRMLQPTPKVCTKTPKSNYL